MTLALVARAAARARPAREADLRAVRPRDRVEVGPFCVQAIRVTHSIVDGIGLAIETPAGTIVHTGDFKLDPAPLDGELPDYRDVRRAGGARRARPVLGLHERGSAGTYAFRDARWASRSASALRAPGRIIVATFASHIHRIQHVLNLAARVGRRVALLGMSMQRKRGPCRGAGPPAGPRGGRGATR